MLTLVFFLELQTDEFWEWLDLAMHPVRAVVSVDMKGEGLISVMV